MKKAFYIISILTSIVSLPAMIQITRAIIAVINQGSFYGTTVYVIITSCLFYLPILSVIFGLIKDKKNTLSKKYLVTFIVINSIIFLMAAFFIFLLLNADRMM